MKEKPLIGITTRLESDSRRFYLGRDYLEAVSYFGGIPILIGLIPERDYLKEIVSRLDGVILPGSDTDVDPLRFGREPHPKLKKVIWEKEETDLIVLAEAESKNIPILGICFGMQILNVYRGGSLIQDIDSQIENPLRHNQGQPLPRNSHTISIEKSSSFYKLCQMEASIVNSHHHQSIEKLGENLIVSATAKDGVVECIEDINDEKFILGVQWHPELSYLSDPLNRFIFETFIKNCSKHIKK